ncbi:MAG: hypothetical protein ABSD71_13015 [Bacteroidales bacterium]|jgi:hypothetical protein
MAVREGYFSKRIAFFCPKDENIIKSYSPQDKIDSEISCKICENSGEDTFIFKTKDLKKEVFYQLIEEDYGK